MSVSTSSLSLITTLKTKITTINRQKKKQRSRRMSQTMTNIYQNGEAFDQFFYNFTNTTNIQTKADLLGCFYRKDERFSVFVNWLIDRNFNESQFVPIFQFMLFHIEYYSYDFVIHNELFHELLTYIDNHNDFKQVKMIQKEYQTTKQKIDVWNGFFTNFINALMKKHTQLKCVYNYRDYHIIYTFVNDTCIPFINAIFHNEIDILNPTNEVVIQHTYFEPFDKEIKERLRKLYDFFGYYFFAMFQIDLITNFEFDHMTTRNKLHYFFSLQVKLLNSMNDVNKYLHQINEYVTTIHKLVDYEHYKQQLNHINQEF